MKRLISILLVGILTCLTPCISFAAVKDDVTVQPAYLYARYATASLQDVSSNSARCKGVINGNGSTKKISMVVSLYKQSGSSWSKIASWNDSTEKSSLIIEKTRSVDAGTYKVVVTGTITATNGSTENVRETTDYVDFP